MPSTTPGLPLEMNKLDTSAAVCFTQATARGGNFSAPFIGSGVNNFFSQAPRLSLSNPEPRPTLPPLGPLTDRAGFSQSISNPATGPTSPVSTIGSDISWRYPGSFNNINHAAARVTSDGNSSPSVSRQDVTIPSAGPQSRYYQGVSGVKRPRSPRLHDESGSYSSPYPNHALSQPSIQTSATITRTIGMSTTSHIASSMRTPTERFSLHLRQQPRAARAGPDGKDRRTIDPPPVLQLLINDFEPGNKADLEYLRANDWVVYTKLVSVDDPPQDLNAAPTHSENSDKVKMARRLLGTTVSSPFFCSDDPDRDNAPEHPATKIVGPPSPSMNVLGLDNRQKQKHDPNAHKDYPGAYFIFADLSVRKAGDYRLEFRLMKMESSALQPGQIVPTISVVVSNIFKVVNAKDFDQVQPSTSLVRGLLDRGAGFPLKLKKGLREGQRRTNHTDSDNDGEADDREDVENEDNGSEK